MSKKNIQYIVLGLIVFATLGILYFYFVKPNSSSVPPQLIFSQAGAGAGSSSTSAAPTDIDLNTLKDPRLQSLVPPNYPTVDASEIGKSNPFQ